MRRVKLAGLVGAVGMAVLIPVVLQSGGADEGKESAPSHGHEPRASQGSSTDHSRRAGSNAPKGDAPQLSSKRSQPSLSSRERRPGESEDDYSMRLTFIDRFERFEKNAGLSDEQRASVIAIMADMQEQSRLTWEAVDDSLQNSTPHDTPHFGVAQRSLRAELLSRLREVLDHDQMISFRRTAAIGLPFHYGLFQPIDLGARQDEG